MWGGTETGRAGPQAAQARQGIPIAVRAGQGNALAGSDVLGDPQQAGITDAKRREEGETGVPGGCFNARPRRGLGTLGQQWGSAVCGMAGAKGGHSPGGIVLCSFTVGRKRGMQQIRWAEGGKVAVKVQSQLTLGGGQKKCAPEGPSHREKEEMMEPLGWRGGAWYLHAFMSMPR